MNDDKDFFDSMNPNLSSFYESDETDEPDSKDHLFPIQDELKKLDSKFAEEKPVSSGSMKEIFEVQDLPSGRKVAKAKLKNSSDPKAVESFLREARLTASLQHPNIIRIYDIAYDDYPWFSMELIEGQSLEEHIKSESYNEWPLYQKLDVFNKICDAIAYAHSKNILHLDIKPDNVRLGPYGEVIVCDWGLAHIMYSDDIQLEDYRLEKMNLENDQTMHGYFRGTPGYMAPERIDNKKTVQSDIFSLGALLYTLLNGHMPFTGKSTSEIIKNTVDGNILQADQNLAVGIKSVYEKSLRPSPNDRYTSVLELQKDVDKFRKGFATSAENAGFLKQMQLVCKRNKLTCSLIALFIIITGTITVNYIYDIQRGKRIVLNQKLKAEKEQQDKEEIARHFSALLVESTKNNTHGFDLKRSIEYLDYAVSQHPENSEAWLVKGYSHFIGHEFDKAYDAFEKSNLDNDVREVQKICLKYSGHQGLLPIDKTLELLTDFGELSKLVLSFFFIYDGQVRPLSEHSQVVEFYLAKRNKTTKLNFHYLNNELDLSNNSSLFNLDSDLVPDSKSFNLLKFLNLKQLNLSNTNFSNLNQLSELELESIDLSHTPVMDLRPLLKIKELKEITLSPNQGKITRGKWPFKINFSDNIQSTKKVEQAVKRLLQSFEAVDLDKSGELSLSELLNSSNAYGERELRAFHFIADKDKNTSLSVEEINDFDFKEFYKKSPRLTPSPDVKP
ncbi:serine/threonine-protein kinase [Lentisphaera marina]|uniref:serine/threonine-protein kinase n=1 Tax=Lentisphaera marina TaxID=1111041 RepID=UPI0023671402|nr:serine/threonine-protein kinase [Lentisphaera marina]MDD7984899.1 serine/threonine-protein kinase [Lentisphaera marina]